MSSDRLSQSVVVVTGGSRGIGQAVARACAAHGARVVAASRSVATLPDGPPAGGIAEAHLDVRSPASVDALYGFIDRSVGRIDALVNCAGAFVFKPIDTISLREWNSVIETNLTGTFLCSQSALVRMKAAGGGRIVMMGSVADRTALADAGAYGASKFGVRGFSRVLTEEGKAHGVFATLLSLGAVDTDAFRDRPEFDPKDMLSVEDVAEAIVEILAKPLHVRVDEVQLMPRKGVL